MVHYRSRRANFRLPPPKIVVTHKICMQYHVNFLPFDEEFRLRPRKKQLAGNAASRGARAGRVANIPKKLGLEPNAHAMRRSWARRSKMQFCSPALGGSSLVVQDAPALGFGQ